MVGKIAIVRLIANCAVTLHLYRSIYEYKIYQPALLHRNTSEVMKAPCRSVNDLCRGTSVPHSTFRQYSDRLGVYRSIKVSSDNYRKLSRYLLYLLESLVSR